MSGYKRQYTLDEDMAIIKYIVASQGYYKTRGVTLWKNLEQSGNVTRTWQSLKNRFLRKVFYNIDNMDIKESHKDRIRTGFEDSKRSAGKSKRRRERRKSRENNNEVAENAAARENDGENYVENIDDVGLQSKDNLEEADENVDDKSQVAILS